jgi:hypothetical protein
MSLTRIGTLAAAAVLSTSTASMVLAHPAGAAKKTTTDDHGALHTLGSIVNRSTDVESSASVTLSCSSSTGTMTLSVSGLNTVDANGNSFLSYFNANGILPNVGWQLGNEAGNIVIAQNRTTSLWAGTLTMTLVHKGDCAKGSAFLLNDQPFATGALKITGVLS